MSKSDKNTTKPESNNNSIIGKIIITNDHIIKVNLISNNLIYGFNILTEKLVSVPVSEKYIENPQVLSLIIKEERARFNYVNSVFYHLKDYDKAKLMSLTDRTFYRIKSETYQKRAPMLKK